MKLITLSLVILIIPTVVSERPIYPFSETVFQNLPPMPKDFWLKKELFSTQQIQASRLTPEYYLQPELIPGWNWSAKRVYNDSHTVGVYGISIYPSRFDVFMKNHTENFTISFILYTGFGVEIYQGAKLVPYHDKNVTIKQTSPISDTFLLTPTYPIFSSTWARIVEYEITTSVYGESIITIMEEKPDEETDTLWSNDYPLYTSGGSILGLQIPKAKIYIHGIKAPVPVDNVPEPELPNYLYLLLIPIIGLLAWRIYGKRKKRNKEEKTE
jgi:hypothetical protein